MNALLKWDANKAEETAQRYFAHVQELREQRKALESLVSDAEKEEDSHGRAESRGPSVRWTLEALKKDALNYSSKTLWQKSNPTAYQTAWSRGVLGECCGHMKRPRKWSRENVELDARRFTSRGQWARSSPSAYHAARRLKIVELCCEHMKASDSPERRPVTIFNF